MYSICGYTVSIGDHSMLRPFQTPPRKENRLQIRIDDETYSILEKAAHYRHGSLSTFVREASLKEAKKIIRDHQNDPENMALSNQDWSLLMDALEGQKQPNETLQKAYEHYKTRL